MWGAELELCGPRTRAAASDDLPAGGGWAAAAARLEQQQRRRRAGRGEHPGPSRFGCRCDSGPAAGRQQRRVPGQLGCEWYDPFSQPFMPG